MRDTTGFAVLVFSCFIIHSSSATTCSNGAQCAPVRIDLYPNSTACSTIYGATGERCQTFGSAFCCPLACGECEIAVAEQQSCSTEEYQCSSGYCIPSSYQCNSAQIAYCLDGADQTDCPSTPPTPSPSPSISNGGCVDGSQCALLDPATLFPNSDACATSFALPDGVRCKSNPEFCCRRSCGQCESRSLTPSPTVSISRNCDEGPFCYESFAQGKLFLGSSFCNEFVGDTGILCTADPTQCCPRSCGLCGSFTQSVSLTPSRSLSASITQSVSRTASRSPSGSPSPSTPVFRGEFVFVVQGVSSASFQGATVQSGFLTAISSTASVPATVLITQIQQRGSDAVVTVRATVDSAARISALTKSLSDTAGLRTNANAEWAALGTGTTATAISLDSITVITGSFNYLCQDDAGCGAIRSVLSPGSAACTQLYQVGSCTSSNTTFCCPVSCGQCDLVSATPSVSVSPSASRPSPSPSQSVNPQVSTLVIRTTVTESKTDPAPVAAVGAALGIVALLACCFAGKTHRRAKQRAQDLEASFHRIEVLRRDEVETLDELTMRSARDSLAHGITLLQEALNRVTVDTTLRYQKTQPEFTYVPIDDKEKGATSAGVTSPGRSEGPVEVRRSQEVLEEHDSDSEGEDRPTAGAGSKARLSIPIALVSPRADDATVPLTPVTSGRVAPGPAASTPAPVPAPAAAAETRPPSPKKPSPRETAPPVQASPAAPSRLPVALPPLPMRTVSMPAETVPPMTESPDTSRSVGPGRQDTKAVYIESPPHSANRTISAPIEATPDIAPDSARSTGKGGLKGFFNRINSKKDARPSPRETPREAETARGSSVSSLNDSVSDALVKALENRDQPADDDSSTPPAVATEDPRDEEFRQRMRAFVETTEAGAYESESEEETPEDMRKPGAEEDSRQPAVTLSTHRDHPATSAGGETAPPLRLGRMSPPKSDSEKGGGGTHRSSVLAPEDEKNRVPPTPDIESEEETEEPGPLLGDKTADTPLYRATSKVVTKDEEDDEDDDAMERRRKQGLLTPAQDSQEVVPTPTRRLTQITAVRASDDTGSSPAMVTPRKDSEDEDEH